MTATSASRTSSTSALHPVERSWALLRGALGTLSCAGPAALHTDSLVAADAALPDAWRACSIAAVVVVGCGVLPWRPRLLCLPVVVALLAFAGSTAAISGALGGLLAVLLERGAASFSTTSRLLQYGCAALLGVSLLAGVVTLMLAASGSWDPLPFSGASAVTSTFDDVAALLGTLFVAAGLAVVAWCARFLLAAGGTPDPVAPPQAHCDRGPYATTSHPMQRGQVLVLVGLALLLGTTGAATVALAVALLLLGPVRHLEARERDARQRPDAAPNH